MPVIPMFSICASFIQEGKLETELKNLASVEVNFTRKIGVLFRKFFQCVTQPHIIWALTEWESEKHHNDAAQSLMKKRRDDRFASIMFGPDPYFEIFCEEEKELTIGEFSDNLNFIIVAHGLVNTRANESFLKLRKERIAETVQKINWLRIFHNTYNSHEFVSFLGFFSEESFKDVRQKGDFLLEEYLFTGLRSPMGMSYLASYNQFVCTPLSLHSFSCSS